MSEKHGNGHFRDFERTTHDRIAGTYESFFAPITGMAAEPLLDAAFVRASCRVLDVATGPGVVASHAARRGARVTGIDISPQMVDLAARALPGGRFLEADVAALPFPDGSFEAVVCAFGLGHFPDAGVAMSECVRVLSPGAWLAVAWWNVPEHSRLQGLMLEAIQEVGARPPPDLPPGPPMFQYSEEGPLRQLLGTAGLSDITVRTCNFNHQVTNAQALWNGAVGSMARVGALVRGQPADVERRLREAFERRACAYEGPTGISLPVSVKIAAGRRA